MRILFVSDWDINQIGGASLVAKRLAVDSSKFGFTANFFSYRGSRFQPIRNFLAKNKIRFFVGLFNPSSFFKMRSEARHFKPDILWFHNINNRWSWSILLGGYHAKYRFVTLHDLTAISPNKVTSKDLDATYKLLYINKSPYTRAVLLLRRRFIRFCVRNCVVIAISHLQAEILMVNGIKVQLILENYIDSCECEPTSRVPKTILFAGRSSLKGLPQTISILRANPDWRLLLAGDIELESIAKEHFDSINVEYLGKLSNTQLFKVIHSVEYVFVLSEYFDTYPTIALEAIVHGAIPVTSYTTGVSDLINQLSSRLVVHPGNIFALPLLSEGEALDFANRAESIIRFITSKDRFWREIHKIFGRLR